MNVRYYILIVSFKKHLYKIYFEVLINSPYLTTSISEKWEFILEKWAINLPAYSMKLLMFSRHATMALTDVLGTSYEPPRKGLPPARERRVACGEAGDAPYGLPSSTKTHFLCVAPPQNFQRTTAIVVHISYLIRHYVNFRLKSELSSYLCFVFHCLNPFASSFLRVG